jgi:DNA-directed RNA polymerase specialized sigma24 family protein
MDTASEGHDKAAVPAAERVWSEFLSVLHTLPPATRAVYLMHALFDSSWEEIECTTGVPKDSCERHVEAARRALREFALGGTDAPRDSDP